MSVSLWLWTREGIFRDQLLGNMEIRDMIGRLADHMGGSDFTMWTLLYAA